MLNWTRSYVHTSSGRRTSTLAEAYALCAVAEREPSAEFFASYFAGRGTRGRTAITGVHEGPRLFARGPELVRRSSAGRLEEALLGEMSFERAAVAVSGGIDSWVLAALLRANGCAVEGWYLESGVPGYCERERILRMAEAVGVECHAIRVTQEDFVAALPEFVKATESPIYGLHPVSKLLFARELTRRGVTRVITGDGADQVMRWDWECDLLPLTLTCFAAQGVRVVAPFLSEEFCAFAREPRPYKAPVRELARRLGVPDLEKSPAVFPEIRGLDVAARTTGILMTHLTERALCAASPA